MEYLGYALMAIGGITMLVCGIWILVLAFQESVLWGLGCLLLSPVTLVFVIMHWDKAKMPFLYNLGGVVLFVVGMMMVPSVTTMAPPV